MRQALATESLPDYRQDGESEPSKREAIRQLMALGHTGAEAHRHYDGFCRQRLVTWIRYIDLMTETPGGRKPKVARDHRLKVVPS